MFSNCKAFKFNNKLNAILRTFSIEMPNALPVIKIPKYLEQNLAKIKFKRKHIKQIFVSNSKIVKNSGNKNILIISGNDSQMNHYFGQTYRSSNKLPLISDKWIKAKTNGEKLQFHIYDENPSKPAKQSNARTVGFESLGLKSAVCEAINCLGISEPTNIQIKTIATILDYKNVICSAETGSGKTIAYLAPIIQMIRDFKELNSEQTSDRLPRGLVVVPTRELAEQVGRVAQHLGSHCGIGVAVMIGGIPKHITMTGMDLIVSTIGLVQPLVQKRVYSLKRLNHIVIDESDTLLDETFSFDVLDLLQSVLIKDNTDEENSSPVGTQIICVSATMPQDLEESLGSVIDLENIEKITTDSLHHIMPHVKQVFYRIHKFQRATKLLEIVKRDDMKGTPVMIFSNRSNSSDWIYHYLNENGVQCLRLNKNISDEERLNQLNRFQEGECDVISCTDLGSRGLDTTRVKHVINYDCPHYVCDYIHRSGRTGRIGNNNNCLVSTLVSFKPDVKMVEQLERALRLNKPIDYVNANIKKQLNQRSDSREGKRHN